MGKTSIEWTRGDDGSAGATWNPIRGCSRLSPGCGGANHQGGCYAEKIAARFSGPGQPFEGFAERSAHGGRWTGKMGLVDDMLTLPLRWKKPRRVFVNSMSDLFHENLPDDAIDKVFAVMALAPQHTFQVLTKRADRMRDYCTRIDKEPVRDTVRRIVAAWPGNAPVPHEIVFPLPNVWLGVSVEDQERADERIPDLLATPAAIRFLSCEPLLGPVDLMEVIPNPMIWSPVHGMTRLLDWVIVGGESGPNSRPFALEWARSIVAQCKAVGVSCFMKQLGAKPVDRPSPQFCHEPIKLQDRKGGDWSEWPTDLRVREFPQVAR